MKIHTRIDHIRDVDRLQSWIYQVARNAIVDHYRARDRKEELALDVPAPETGRSEKARKENLDCLPPMIRSLPERYREVVMLSEINGLPHKGIAARTGLSVSGVKSRVLRGRALTREMILSSCHLEFDSQVRMCS